MGGRGEGPRQPQQPQTKGGGGKYDPNCCGAGSGVRILHTALAKDPVGVHLSGVGGGEKKWGVPYSTLSSSEERLGWGENKQTQGTIRASKVWPARGTPTRMSGPLSESERAALGDLPVPAELQAGIDPPGLCPETLGSAQMESPTPTPVGFYKGGNNLGLLPRLCQSEVTTPE